MERIYAHLILFHSTSPANYFMAFISACQEVWTSIHSPFWAQKSGGAGRIQDDQARSDQV